MNTYREHPKWQPVKKLYYKKFYNVIRVSKSARERIKIPPGIIDYRIVDRVSGIEKISGITAFSSVASVYTNNEDLISFLLDNYQIAGIETPYNDQHTSYLKDPNRNILYRDKAWYGKYHHKVRVYETWRLRNTKSDPKEILYSFKELFKASDSRWNGQNRDLSQFAHYRYYSYPTIYTNNEPSIMLLKMQYNQQVAIYVETVVTPDFLK